MLSATRIPRADRGTRMLLCLMLLAVSLRAMIPVGYMPDTAALRHGVVRIGLCTSTGMVSIVQMLGQADTGHGRLSHMTGDSAGHDHPDQDHAAGAECPFWAAAHVAVDLPPLTIVPLLAAIRDQVVRFSAPAALPVLPPAGPPLGPRAPPSA